MRHHLVWLPLLILLAFLVNFNALFNSFAWDEDYFLLENPGIRSLQNVPLFFTTDFLSSLDKRMKTGYWRPFSMLTYCMDYSLWELKPFGYHLTNLILHLLATLSLTAFLGVLFPEGTVWLLAGFLFLIHPVHCEDVAFVTGRTDMVAAIFLFGSLFLILKALTLKGKKGIALLVFSSLLYALALLSKEMAVSFPLLLLLCHLYLRAQKRPSIPWSFQLPFWLLLALYLFVRIHALKIMPDFDLYGQSLFSTVIILLRAFATYIRLLFFPNWLSIDYSTIAYPLPDSLSNGMTLMALTMGAGFCLFLLFALRQRWWDVAFAQAWFFLSLLPVISTPLRMVMAERFLYIPSVAHGLFCALLFQKASQKTLALLALMALVALFSLLSIRRNADWQDNFNLYSSTVRSYPHSYQAHFNLGSIYQEKGFYEEAMKEYRKSLQLNPYQARPYGAMGTLLFQKGREEEALALFKRGLRIEPSMAEMRLAYAQSLMMMGREEQALAQIQQVIAHHPYLPEAHYLLGEIYVAQGKSSEALAQWEKALSLKPDFDLAKKRLEAHASSLARDGLKEEKALHFPP